MKKVLLLLVLILGCLTSAHAQAFLGGFYNADEDAWFDKEPYFACINNAVNNYGQGLYFSNVWAVYNNETVYTFPYTWGYGEIITLGRQSGVELSNGDTITLYIGQQCLGTWTYHRSSSLPDIKLRGVGKLLKKSWKYLKKIK